MRVHHLNCTTIHTNLPYPGVTHCLLVETSDGLVLVDTGFGVGDYAAPTRHVRWFTAVNGIPCDVEETAVQQIAGLGYEPKDVRHILLTHLHLDHVGGIVDFPWAQVHVFEAEYETAMRPRWFSAIERVGYVPAHWAHSPKWSLHSLAGETWMGLDCARVLEGTDWEMLLVPLVGHSRGHCGVAVRTADRWLLHCGDAYVRNMQVDPDNPRSPFPRVVGPLVRKLFPSQPLAKLQALRRDHGEEVELFCSHDPNHFARLRGISVEEAIGRS